MIKTVLMQMTEQRLGKPIQVLIRDQIEAGRTLDETAEILGVTRATLYNWMERMEGQIEAKRTVRFGAEDSAAVA